MSVHDPPGLRKAATAEGLPPSELMESPTVEEQRKQELDDIERQIDEEMYQDYLADMMADDYYDDYGYAEDYLDEALDGYTCGWDD